MREAKRIFFLSLLFLYQYAGAMEPSCSGDGEIQNPTVAEIVWNDAALIYDTSLPSYLYDDIKVCPLSNAPSIGYAIDEMLTPQNRPEGAVLTFLDTPTHPVVEIGTTDVTMSNSLNLPSINLNAPTYYLHQNLNRKNSPDSEKRGLFRFYTRVSGRRKNACVTDLFRLGYEHIRNNIYSSFFQKLKINNAADIELNTANGAFAAALDVVMNNGNSKVLADVFFIEGKNTQKKIKGGGSICAIDVYVMFILKPENSPNFKSSGDYPLSFSWSP